MTDSNSVILDKRGQAFWITINRPDKRNAINGDVIAGIAKGYRQAHDDRDVRVIVLTGAGDKASAPAPICRTRVQRSHATSPGPTPITPTCCGRRRTRPSPRSRASAAPVWPAAWGFCA